MKEISRRNFLVGSGAIAASFAATGLIGCSSPSGGGVKPSPEDGTDVSDGMRWSWEQTPTVPAEGDISATYDCEVCIIGAGSAGVPAALYAARHGVDALVLQKHDATQSNGWSFAAFNTRNDEAFGIHYDPAGIRNVMAEYGSGRANVDLICGIMDKSGDCLDWLTDQVADKMKLSMVTDVLAGFPDSKAPHCVYYWMHDDDYTSRYHAFDDALELIADRAEEDGARFLYGTPATQLIVNDEGSITGVYAQTKDGSIVRVNASMGVLLATGDVTDDEELVEYFIPGNIGIDNMSPYGTCTGDGHKMAYWVGAKWDCPPLCQGFSTGSGHDNYDGGATPAYSDATLRVNNNGQRFVNESITGSNPIYGGSPLMTADALQPGHIAWSIYDQKLSPAITLEGIKDLIGVSVFTGDTLAEIADQAGINAENLEATVARYNEIVESGMDTDFGVPTETLFERSIVEPPFYAVRRKPLNMAAIGGVQSNEQLQVIDEDHKPIKGLYVAGNAMGACYGYEYPWSHFSASNKMHAMAGGILAIRSMMGVLDKDFS